MTTTAGKQWIRVDLWDDVFTIAVEGGKVVWVPRIARWALNQPERMVADHHRRQGAQFKRL